MMRIVHLTSVHCRHDIRIFVKMCRCLAARGHEVHLIAPEGGPGNGGLREGVHLHLVDRPRNRLQRVLRTSKRVWELAARIPADLYHFHDPELLLRAVPFQRRAGKPVIYDAHEDVRDAVLGKHWIPGMFRRGLSFLTGRMEDRASRRLAAVVAATPAIARRFSDHPCCAVINNYPFSAEFEPDRWQPAGARAPCFAYAGVITEIRGVREMIRALPLAGKDTRLAIAGEWLSPQLRQDCARLPGWPQVDEKGLLGRAEVRTFLRSAVAGLVLFYPLRNHVQARPNKMFEYMSAALPVIASDFPLWRSIIDGAGCGLLVDPRDPKAIAAAMRWIVEHPDEARAMGRRGRKAVTDRYNWEREFPKLLQLYESLTRPTGHGPPVPTPRSKRKEAARADLTA